MVKSSILALALSLATSQAVFQGFNYGSTFTDNSAKNQAAFESEFKAAKELVGTSGFNSARLFTTIQAGTTNTPISAIPAAIKEDVTLLLGLWGSAGQDVMTNEIAALKSAISTYGDEFTKRVAAISVGSEDLYRTSPVGIINKSGLGATPNVIADYISQVRKAVAGTALEKTPIGHVDTWTAWVNTTGGADNRGNQAVIDAVDFVGMDAYPYFQNTMANSIDNAKQLFYDAWDQVKQVTGKDVWITESGWPVSGKTENQAEASIQNAQKYWKDVACSVIGKANTWWYILQDAAPTTPSPSFGLVGATLSNKPLYDLSCDASSSSSTNSGTKTSGGSNAATTGTGSGTGSSNPSASGFTTVPAGNATASYTAGSPTAPASTGEASSTATGVATGAASSLTTISTTALGAMLAVFAML